MNRRDLFLGHYRKLGILVDSTDHYEILECAGKLRSLLLDGSKSAYDLANKEHREPLLFDVILPTSVPSELSDGLIAQVGVSAGSMWPQSPHRVRDMSRDAFLAMTAGVVRGTPFSARELVLYLANVGGAIHAGVPKSEADHVIESLDSLHISALPTTLAIMRTTARVCLDAMAPLFERLR